MAVDKTHELRIVLTLPDQVGTTVDGVLPTNSIQSLNNTLTYTFAITELPGTTTTNS